MVRINLLPSEIIERRRYERFFPYVFIAAGVLIGVIVLTWAAMQFFVNERTQTLQQTKESTQQLTEQAAALEVFDKRELELAARQEASEQALIGRVNIGRVAEELSLVLPAEVWLENIVINEASGITLTGNTPYVGKQTMDEGYKSVAATLVRINGITAVYDVWLLNASEVVYSNFEGSTDASAPVVTFDSNAKIEREQPVVAVPPSQ